MHGVSFKKPTTREVELGRPCACQPCGAPFRKAGKGRGAICLEALYVIYSKAYSAEKLHGKKSCTKKTHVVYDLLNVFAWSVSVWRA